MYLIHGKCLTDIIIRDCDLDLYVHFYRSVFFQAYFHDTFFKTLRKRQRGKSDISIYEEKLIKEFRTQF